MKKTKIYLSAINMLIASFTYAQEENLFKMKWDNGFKLESADKNFKLKFGGRIMWDNAFFFQDDSLEANFGVLNNGSEFRRARFYNSGTIYNNVEYKIQFDFAGGKATFKDVYITIKGIPAVGHLTVGHFKEPFRLEALTSSKYITFMERALPIEMVPERNTGFMLSNEFIDKRLGWQGGIFRRSDGSGNDKQADDGYAITTRLTGLPFVNEDKTKLLHLGVGFSYRKPESREYEVEARPEAHLGNKYVNTGAIADVFEIQMFNAEAALVIGPFSLQSEYTQSNVATKATTSENYAFSSYYAEVSYFLTGEHRNYKNSYLGFDRVKPKNNFGNGEKGLGAWQLALRYSAIDLNSGDPNTTGIQGGELADITAGINWYLNPSTRIMLNYVLAQVKDKGNTNIVQMRFQLDF